MSNIYLGQWKTDTRTGKQYMVIQSGPKSFSESQTMCTELGGYLPEPRDELENNFLDSLTYNIFFLGMTDSVVEGDWRWRTDFTQVTWKNWVHWTNYADPPNGGTKENCAMMLKQINKGMEGHSTKAWADFVCSKRIDEMSVVCEKGEDILTNLVNCQLIPLGTSRCVPTSQTGLKHIGLFLSL